MYENKEKKKEEGKKTKLWYFEMKYRHKCRNQCKKKLRHRDCRKQRNCYPNNN